MAVTFELYTRRNNGVLAPSQKPNTAYLKASDWDDFHFKTLFSLVVFDHDGIRHDIGGIKIGRIKQDKGWSSDLLPKRFKELEKGFFSLGQSDEYYSTIQSLEPNLRKNILDSLRDVVDNEDPISIVMTENVFKTSLLRDVSLTSISGQFKRILQGGDVQTGFHFKYEIPQGSKTAGLKLEFHVDPDSTPPSNVHVLIGRNGVGKTHLLNNMVQALVADDETIKKVGTFSVLLNEGEIPSSSKNTKQLFSGVVSVAFSAFDPFEPYPEQKDKTKGFRYSYVGLKRSSNRGGKRGTPMSHDMLTNEFVNSLMACVALGRIERWKVAIRNLESDPLFNEIALSEITFNQDGDLENIARSLYKKMSSGHGIVLLTITKLVEKVEEKTLVLIDEPEGHLHPPLLSAFIRSLSDLLSHRNGVAIIATHSPVIVQEVPKHCVWKLRRTGLQANAERPEVETFGENIGILTREIFGLEVTESGFHQLLKEALNNHDGFQRVIHYFGNNLGTEARGILRGLIAERNNEKEQ